MTIISDILGTVERIAASVTQAINARARSITRLGRVAIFAVAGLLGLVILAVVAATSPTAAVILVAALLAAVYLYTR